MAGTFKVEELADGFDLSETMMRAKFVELNNDCL
jgi:hypothetical protein